jgi:hypothetical protein
MIALVWFACARPAPTPAPDAAAAASPAPEAGVAAAAGGPTRVEMAPRQVQIAAPAEGLDGCVRTEDAALGVVLDCPRGKVVLQLLSGGASAEVAAAAVVPPLDDVRRMPFDLRFQTELGGSSVNGLMLEAPSGGGAWLLWDAQSPQGKAAACLDRAANGELDAWCRVAVESVWGPRATGPVR